MPCVGDRGVSLPRWHAVAMRRALAPGGPTPVLSWVPLCPRGGQNQSQTWFNAHHQGSCLLTEVLTLVLGATEANREIIPYFGCEIAKTVLGKIPN